MKANIKKRLVKERGASNAEYALLLALIAVATIAALQMFKEQFTTAFSANSGQQEQSTPANYEPPSVVDAVE